MFAAGRQTEWRNRLIWGDRKYILPRLPPDFAGKVNLVYIAPRSIPAKISQPLTALEAAQAA